MTFGKLTIDRVKNSKGLYEFGFWFNISTDEMAKGAEKYFKKNFDSSIRSIKNER